MQAHAEESNDSLQGARCDDLKSINAFTVALFPGVLLAADVKLFGYLVNPKEMQTSKANRKLGASFKEAFELKY